MKRAIWVLIISLCFSTSAQAQRPPDACGPAGQVE